jgi:CRP/FNR family transcriptional regulator, nitrogen oxide reductase regulator
LSSVFLEGLTKPEVHTVLAAATLRRYPANCVLTCQDDPADYFFLLRTGCARTFYITQQGRKVLLRWLLPGEIVGGTALLASPSLYLASTEMVRNGSLFVWHRHIIRDLAARYPKLLDNALLVAIDHLTWFVATHMALVSNTARERLAHVLLTLARGIGRKVPGGIQLDITNEQLANAANITLFTASRFLSEWHRNGALEKKRGRLTVCDPNRLFLPSSLL